MNKKKIIGKLRELSKTTGLFPPPRDNSKMITVNCKCPKCGWIQRIDKDTLALCEGCGMVISPRKNRKSKKAKNEGRRFVLGN